MKRLLLSIPCALLLFCCKNASKDSPVKPVQQKQTDQALREKTAFFRMDTLTQLPPEFEHLVKGQINKIYKVDFTGDGKQDIICDYIPQDIPLDKNDGVDYEEIWVTSEARVVKSMGKSLADCDYLRFVNLDKDPEPEIFRAFGFEDGIDYWFEDQNLTTGLDELLFYVFPVIIEDGKRYWGYAWDIQDIAVRKDSGNVYIQSSKDHDLTIEWETIIDPKITRIPVVFFYGHHTQESKIENIRNVKWRTVDELSR